VAEGLNHSHSNEQRRGPGGAVSASLAPSTNVMTYLLTYLLNSWLGLQHLTATLTDCIGRQ